MCTDGHTLVRIGLGPHVHSQKGRTVGQPLGQTVGRTFVHTPNPRLRMERLARQWEQDDVAAALEELCTLIGEPEPRIDAGLVSK